MQHPLAATAQPQHLQVPPAGPASTAHDLQVPLALPASTAHELQVPLALPTSTVPELQVPLALACLTAAHELQAAAGCVARRGLRAAAATRPFTLHELARALRDPPRHTVYVEPGAGGLVEGARGVGAARVAAACRAAPHAAAACAVLCGAANALRLRLVAGVAPHHDLAVWPPPALLLLARPPPPLAPEPPLAPPQPSPSAGHACPFCGRVYSRRYGLRIHVRTHTGARPLRCGACGRAFADPSNLNKHRRLHDRPPRAPNQTT